MSLTFGSLCTGIGGIDIGLERVGMICKWQCEIDDHATRVLEKHWPDVKRYRDMKELTGHGLEPVDLICAGVPCTPWSVAGKQMGVGDERDLWPDFWRLARVVRPRIIFLENVPGFAAGGGLERCLADLAEGGFDAEWDTLSAANVGAPHLRKRLWVVAHTRRWVLAGSGQPRATPGSVERSCDGRGDSWWETEPNVGRVADGVPNRSHRLRCLGNAVVPQCAEFVGRRIMRAFA